MHLSFKKGAKYSGSPSSSKRTFGGNVWIFDMYNVCKKYLLIQLGVA